MNEFHEILIRFFSEPHKRDFFFVNHILTFFNTELSSFQTLLNHFVIDLSNILIQLAFEFSKLIQLIIEFTEWAIFLVTNNVGNRFEPEYQWYFYFLLALYKNFQRRIIIITDNTDGDTNGVIFFGFNVIVNEAQSLLRESLKQIYLHCYLTLRLL